MSDVTRLLNAVDAGDPKAADQLLPLVYEELRKLAVVRMANEKAGHTLQPTALVHEAWLKIAGDGNGHFANRRHFFKAAATAMQQILIDNARRKQRVKHGANQIGDELHESRIAVAVPSEELLAVHEALGGLAAEEPLAAELVQLRYFVGLTMEEAAEVLGLALRKTERLWAFARAWLRTELDAEKE
jgi:RNA polymerase sigma factor (TIGR02999 family)